jgi:outer membrane lipoprotein-sorting protein
MHGNAPLVSRLRGLAFLGIAGMLVTAWPLAAAELEPPPEGLEARELARGAEDALRSSRTYLEAEMTVVSPRLSRPRVVAFRSWDDRPGKRSFIRILSPAKDAGSGFLKLHPNLWMYVPRVERTLRIPPSMMLQPWMGSDFTNDDLVRESSALDDYDHRLLGVDPSPAEHPGLRAYVVEYIPHEDAPVVWGKIVAWLETEHGTPLLQDFYDEDGEKLRSMRFADIRAVEGRHVPFSWSMTPLDKQGHETRIQIGEIRFDIDIDDSVFTTRHLKQKPGR